MDLVDFVGVHFRFEGVKRQLIDLVWVRRQEEAVVVMCWQRRWVVWVVRHMAVDFI